MEVDAKIPVGEIIGDGLGKGMEVIGKRFDAAEIYLPQVVAASKEGKPVIVTNKTQGYDFATTLSISDRQCGMLLAGGLLNFTREQHSEA